MKKMLLALFVVSLAVAMACGGAPKKTGPNYDELPDWIRQGSGFWSSDDGKAFFGVGTSEFNDHVARRQDADSAARAELARVFKVEVDSLLKSHRKALKKGDGEMTLASFTRATEVYSSAEIHLGEIVDHHFDPNTGVEYALCVLDLEGYKETIRAMKELDAATIKMIEDSAAAAFEELHLRKAEGR